MTESPSYGALAPPDAGVPVSASPARSATTVRRQRGAALSVASAVVAVFCFDAWRRSGGGGGAPSSSRAAVASSSLRAAGRVVGTAADSGSSASSGLGFSVRSEGYSPVGSDVLRVYGSRWDHVVEPHRRTALEATNRATGGVATYRWEISVISSGSGSAADAVAVRTLTGASTSHAFDEPGATYRVALVETTPASAEGATATVRSVSSEAVACKYVRREIRQLTDDDRETYLSALLEVRARGERERERERERETYLSALLEVRARVERCTRVCVYIYVCMYIYIYI